MRCVDCKKEIYKDSERCRSCASLSKHKDKPFGFLKGVSSWNKGLDMSGDKNPSWKGGFPNCVDCGKQLKSRRAIRCKKCSVTGEQSHVWKGGRSRGYKTGYYSAEYKMWRMSVFERDGFRCQGCGVVGVYLTAHHIKSFAHYPELRFEINNGVTLCESCHKLTDNYKGKGKIK